VGGALGSVVNDLDGKSINPPCQRPGSTLRMNGRRQEKLRSVTGSPDIAEVGFGLATPDTLGLRGDGLGRPAPADTWLHEARKSRANTLVVNRISL
jgi:hypothetical protein